MVAQPRRGAGIGVGHFWSAADHDPPWRLVRPRAGHTRTRNDHTDEANISTVETNGDLFWFGPGHDRLRLARVDALGDLLLDLLECENALEIRDHLVDDHALIQAHYIDLHHDDVCGIADELA